MVVLRRTDPTQIVELNRLAGLLEAANLYDVIELVCDRLFRGRRIITGHDAPFDRPLALDPDVRTTIAALIVAIEQEPTPDAKRLAALRVLNNSSQKTRSA